ncbi:hypothetical protein J1605_013646 [Eschrichtius robustus]|uniref:Uncharacterized protein n=1 Tax=Eschrichtius robustus TaxID=9764 RepID=A0AB34GJ85_ESCRO|nr:hypothetical protein J1605_013646 [Eschrichtius robustus]
MSGGFNFQVTDGLNFAPRQIFSITARALIISLEVNRGLSIFPGKILTLLSALYLHACFNLHLGSMKPLSARDLRAATNDVDSAGNRTMTFTVVSSPRLGRLVRVSSDNSTEDVSVFTQHLNPLSVLVEAGAGSSVEAQPGQCHKSDVVREECDLLLEWTRKAALLTTHSPFLSKACRASGLAQCFDSGDRGEPLLWYTRHQTVYQAVYASALLDVTIPVSPKQRLRYM